MGHAIIAISNRNATFHVSIPCQAQLSGNINVQASLGIIVNDMDELVERGYDTGEWCDSTECK